MSDPLRDAYVTALEAENEMLRARLRDMEREYGFRDPVPFAFGLTASEAKIMSLLVSRDFASRAQMMTAVMADRHADADGQPEMKIIDVYVCKIRKKVAPFGIEITSLWGRGYRLSPEMKAKVAVYLAGQSQIPEAAE